jgi:urease subunit alpha
MFGAMGRAVNHVSATFVSQAAEKNNIKSKYGLQRMIMPCKSVRNVKKQDMIHNNLMPEVEVDAQTYEVKADGILLSCEPMAELPLAQRYFLF